MALTDPYEFWRKIGSPKLVVAPMVDNSELAYRLLTRKYGAQLVYTQMFNAYSFVHSKDLRKSLFDTCPEDRPLVVQFAGHDPQLMLQAAKMVEDKCDAVDINLGCPQGIAKRGRYGAYLMEELDLLADIVSTMVKGLKVPVFCKTRIYDDFETSIRLCETLVNAGASALTIHGRRRDEKGQQVAACNWYMIGRIKEHFSKRSPPIPIIANGGIETFDDVLRCLEITKADAVMSSEAILENPALFIRNSSPHLEAEVNVITLTEQYLELCQQHPVYHSKVMRSHVMKMLYRYHNENTEIRDMCSMGHSIEDFVAVCKACRAFEESCSADKQWVSWYARHREGDSWKQMCSAEDKKVVLDPDHQLDLTTSFMRGNAWEGEVCADEEDGGIFSALNMFG